MAEIQKVSLVQSKPGIRRDGTNLDGENYSDGKWVRFQRGRPKKMGGYSRSSSFLSGPVRDVQVWSRGQLNNVFTFSGHQIEVTQIDENGNGSSVTRVTPLADFTGNDEYLWSTDTMFDAAAGGEATIILAVPTKTLSNIDDFTEQSLYFGLADGSAEFEAVADANAVASGGVFVTSPYAVLYGSDGKVTWSNANEPQNYTTGDAGSARVTGSKIVQGHALRSGSGASGLLWTLDSLIKMEYIGGNAIFRFSKVGVSSVLAQNSVIEYDGVFYWIGIDRFLTSNGATVAEVPNDMNLNWFFDNLNYAQRQKIWAMKVPRFGEIWWFFPRGDAEECTHAIILNLREQCWYDCELARSAGFYSQVFRYPIMFGADNNRNRSVVLTIESGTVAIGDVVSGGTSGATGVVVSFVSATEVIVELTSPVELTTGEQLTFGTTTTCYSFSGDLETSFVALNAETTWSASLVGWFVDATSENVYVESVQELCAVSGDTAINIDVAIENPSGTGDLVITILDELDNVLSSYGNGLGMPSGWPSATTFNVTVPSGTTGKLRVLASVVGFMATYDKIVVSGIALAP